MVCINLSTNKLKQYKIAQNNTKHKNIFYIDFIKVNK